MNVSEERGYGEGVDSEEPKLSGVLRYITLSGLDIDMGLLVGLCDYVDRIDCKKRKR